MPDDGGQRAEGGTGYPMPYTLHPKPYTLHPAPSASRGFTLLEILLAIFILVLVVSAVFGAFSGTFKVVNETETQEDVYAAARVTLARICEDLSSACKGGLFEAAPSGGNATRRIVFVGEDRTVDDKSADRLRFLSYAHISFKGGRQIQGPAEISYYMQYREKTGDFDLYRSDTLDYLESAEDEAGGLRLCEGLKWLDFVYYDEEGDPHNFWDAASGQSKGALPSRVEITVAFDNVLDPENPLQFMTGVALPPIL